MAYMTDIPEQMRIELAKYLNDLKEKRELGFNQISVRSKINARSLNLILNGETKRISPYQLQNLASVLKVDYKELYKIVGYLKEEDFEVSQKVHINMESSDSRITIYDDVSYIDDEISFGNAIEYLKIPALGNSNEFFALEFNNTCMTSVIPNGAVAIIEKDGIIKDNEIGLFFIEGKSIIRRYVKEGKVTMLIGTDRDTRPIIIEKSTKFYVVGKVVKVMYDM